MISAKTGYVTVESATDVRAWSGLNAHILQALREAGLDMVVADNLGPAKLLWPRLKARIYHRWLGKSYSLDRDQAVARRWSQQAARRLATQGNCQTVVSTGTIPIAQLPAQYQTVIWSDATFHSLRSTYPGFKMLCRSSIKSGDWLEQRAFDRSALICFSSEWAAADAAAYYSVPEHKLAVIPYGANCPPAYPDEATAIANVRSRSRSQCRLVFIGVDWERKGGPLVLETAQRLHDRGIPVHLTLAGWAPPANLPLPRWVECSGFLNKQIPSDCQKWDALLRGAHFLIVPSTAECYGLVYAEASAYGVPSVARNVGGVSSVVRHGRNGLLFTVTEGAEAYATAVAGLWHDPCAYEQLALTSYREWKQRLNWQVAGRRLTDQIDRCWRLRVGANSPAET